MALLILEMLLALAVIVGIMVWTLKTRTDTPIEDASDTSGELEKPSDSAADSQGQAPPDQRH